MMDAADAERAYLRVIDDLRQSEMVRRRQLEIAPARLHIEEIRAIFACLPDRGRLLDVGTGPGIIPETFLRLGYSVVTVDVPPRKEMHRELVDRLTALGAEGHFARVGQEPVPIAPDSVDVAFAGDVIEHLAGSPRPFLAEIARVIKPGGAIVLTTPNAVRLPVRLRVALGHSNWPPVAQYIANQKDVTAHLGHHHEYTSDELQFVLKDAGYTEIAVRCFEDTLARPGILRSPSDLATQDRFGTTYWRRRKASAVAELARRSVLRLVRLCPRLASTLIATARKPPGS
jgi:2-polyprenyl-3-methyl-5-hydroxy-6-metoxy-1,4-benzoquinol methylase